MVKDVMGAVRGRAGAADAMAGRIRQTKGEEEKKIEEIVVK
jgi:hypothetical protein